MVTSRLDDATQELAALAKKELFSLLVARPPSLHRLQNRLERAAEGGQLILYTRRNFRKHFAIDDTVMLHARKSERKRARADAIKRTLEFTETLHSREKIADDKNGPLAADHVQRVLDGAGSGCVLYFFHTGTLRLQM